MIPKMSGYVHKNKVKERDKDKINRLMSFEMMRNYWKNIKLFGPRLKIMQSYQTRHNALFIMIIPNKRELQQIAFNHPSDTELKDCANLKKMYCKIISFLIIDITRASDNPLHFRKLSGRT